MGVRLRGDWRELEEKLHQLAGGIPRRVKEAIAEGVKSRTLRRFEESRAPDGTPWPPLSPVTLARSKRRRKGAKPLFNQGRFRNSIAWTVRGDAIVVGTNVVYARIHQYGGYAGRGRKVRIPARPYLGITEEDRREAERLLKEWLQR